MLDLFNYCESIVLSDGQGWELGDWAAMGMLKFGEPSNRLVRSAQCPVPLSVLQYNLVDPRGLVKLRYQHHVKLQFF